MKSYKDIQIDTDYYGYVGIPEYMSIQTVAPYNVSMFGIDALVGSYNFLSSDHPNYTLTDNVPIATQIENILDSIKHRDFLIDNIPHLEFQIFKFYDMVLTELCNYVTNCAGHFRSDYILRIQTQDYGDIGEQECYMQLAWLLDAINFVWHWADGSS
jgi:hypothetical protein